MSITHSVRRAAYASFGLACIAGRAPALHGQTSVELGGGLTYPAQAAASQGGTYSRGVNVQVSAGRELARSAGVRIDLLGMQFDRAVQYYPPCPPPGCTRSYSRRESNWIIGATADALLDVGPRGILYVVGGPGVYDVLAPSSALRLGASVGAGLAVPVGAGLRVFAEARWHRLFGSGARPSSLTPITVGLRF